MIIIKLIFIFTVMKKKMLLEETMTKMTIGVKKTKMTDGVKTILLEKLIHLETIQLTPILLIKIKNR